MHTFLRITLFSTAMELKDLIERVHSSNEFELWEKDHLGFYLAHVFVMQDEANAGTYQIGYYNSEKDKMVTFIVTPDRIDITQEQDVMKAKQTIAELDVEKVKINIEDAIKKGKECREEHYKNEIVMKSFFIIQELDGEPVFNITYLTPSFKTINIKIHANDGKVVKHTIGVIAEFS